MINIPHNQRFNSIQDFQFNQEPIGSGSFGVVKLARHKLTCRLYAVKVVNTHTFRSILYPQTQKPNSSKEKYNSTRSWTTHTSSNSGTPL